MLNHLPDNKKLDLAAEWLRLSTKVIVFTGAGISAESGVPTFRDDTGFWQRFPPEVFATWKGIVRTALLNPVQLAEFIHAVIEPIAIAEPNAGHRAIVDIENQCDTLVVTQNIDGLHQSAGSRRVLEIHGAMNEVVTLRGKRKAVLTNKQFRQIADKLTRIRRRPFSLSRLLLAIRPFAGLGITGGWRPNLVLFGDGLAEPDWSQARQASRICDCFITVGTSGLVMPAAMLPHEAIDAGAKLIHIDPAVAGKGLWLKGNAGDVLPELVNRAFGTEDGNE